MKKGCYYTLSKLEHLLLINDHWGACVTPSIYQRLVKEKVAMSLLPPYETLPGFLGGATLIFLIHHFQVHAPQGTASNIVKQ